MQRNVLDTEELRCLPDRVGSHAHDISETVGLVKRNAWDTFGTRLLLRV